ncbi:MAG: hypothetical protein L0K86_05960 [Actinomycetia bacterium]|nr:hypothetical protein [Actinomycetes bacterium]
MRARSTRDLVVLTASVIIVATGCSSDDTVAGASDGPTASTYAEALDNVPADTATFEFHDVAAAESRLGIEDEHDPRAYIDAIQEDGAVSSALLPYLAMMSDTAWDATDIVWEVQAGTPPDSLGVRRLDDDVDLDAAVEEFKDAGYSGESASGGTLLTAELDDLASKDPARYVELGLAELVLPDRHLIVSAPNQEALATYTDMGESLADAGTFDDLAGDDAGLEFLYAQADESACSPVANPTGTGTDSDAVAKKILEPYEDLGTPEATTLTIATDDDHLTATARLAFDDADTAESDLDARSTLLNDGTSLVTGKPFSTYLTVADATTNDSVETIELDADDTPYRLMEMVAQRDVPFFACAPA